MVLVSLQLLSFTVNDTEHFTSVINLVLILQQTKEYLAEVPKAPDKIIAKRID